MPMPHATCPSFALFASSTVQAKPATVEGGRSAFSVLTAPAKNLWMPFILQNSRTHLGFKGMMSYGLSLSFSLFHWGLRLSSWPSTLLSKAPHINHEDKLVHISLSVCWISLPCSGSLTSKSAIFLSHGVPAELRSKLRSSHETTNAVPASQ